MKAQKTLLQTPLCSPKTRAAARAFGAHLWGMSHQHQSLPRDPALSPLLGGFCPCGGVQRAAYSSSHTRHLQAAELRRWEALEGGNCSRFPVRPSPIQEKTSRASLSCPWKGWQQGWVGRRNWGGIGKELETGHTPPMFSVLETFLRASS